MVRVGLLWHSLDSGNLGIRALTLAHLHLLDGAAAALGRPVEARLFGQPPWEGLAEMPFEGRYLRLARRYDLSASAVSRGAVRTLREFSACDLLIDIGEGDGFTDLYGRRRYAKQLAAKWLALRSGRPLVLAPQTIGPFATRSSRIAAAIILRRAARIFARDGESAGVASRLGRRVDVEEFADVAFDLPGQSGPSARTRGEADPVRVGINPSGLLYAGGGPRLRVDYAAAMHALVEALAVLPRVEIHLVPHVASRPGATDDDVGCCRALAGRYPALRMSPNFSDPRAAKSFIAGLDFFVGSRMHACIAAYSGGVALLPLAYSRKATGLFASLAYPIVADLATASADDVPRLALEAFARRGALREAIALGNRMAQRRLDLYRERLAEILAACG